ncbi:recombination protein O N-terminal domain-containing protein [bacterium]|nr:recombination protein O N-terminal domain-containing protein [bacterium]
MSLTYPETTTKAKALVVTTRLAGRGARWVTLFLEEKGPLSFFVAGASSSKSKWTGRFDPLNLLEVEWIEGRTGIRRLRMANLLDAHIDIKREPKTAIAVLSGLRLVVDAIPEGESHPHLFKFFERGAQLEAPPPLFGLGVGFRLLHAGGWLPHREGREGEIQDQLLQASPQELMGWEWPEVALEGWYRDFVGRWRDVVGTGLSGIVPNRFLESPQWGE